MEIVGLEAAQTRTTGYTHRVRVTHEDIPPDLPDAAGYSLDITSVPKGRVVRNVAMVLREAFQDTEDATQNSTTLAVTLTEGGGTLLSAQQINENGATVPAAASNAVGIATVDAQIRLLFAGLGLEDQLSLSDLNRGIVDVYLSIADLSRI